MPTDKREFVFLSQLQSQATISWVAFGWPDGAFFAAHKLGDRRMEMMEISLTDHPGQRRVGPAPGENRFQPRGLCTAISLHRWGLAGPPAVRPDQGRPVTLTPDCLGVAMV